MWNTEREHLRTLRGQAEAAHDDDAVTVYTELIAGTYSYLDVEVAKRTLAARGYCPEDADAVVDVIIAAGFTLPHPDDGAHVAHFPHPD